jgi:hypothetical protein
MRTSVAGVLGSGGRGFHHQPVGLLESNVFTDTQFARLSLQQIAYCKRLLGGTQLHPGSVFMLRFDLAYFHFVVLRLDLRGP